MRRDIAGAKRMTNVHSRGTSLLCLPIDLFARARFSVRRRLQRCTGLAGRLHMSPDAAVVPIMGRPTAIWVVTIRGGVGSQTWRPKCGTSAEVLTDCPDCARGVTG